MAYSIGPPGHEWGKQRASWSEPERDCDFFRDPSRIQAQPATLAGGQRLSAFARRIFLLFANHGCDRLQLIPLCEVDEFHTLRVSSSLSDIFHKRADHLAANRNQHD